MTNWSTGQGSFRQRDKWKKIKWFTTSNFNPFPCSHIVYLTVFIFLIITVLNNPLNEEKLCETYNAMLSIRILKENLWSLPISHHCVVPGPWVLCCWVPTLTYISIYPQPWVLFMYLKGHSRQCYLIGAVFTSGSLVYRQTVILIGRAYFELIQKRVLNPRDVLDCPNVFIRVIIIYKRSLLIWLVLFIYWSEHFSEGGWVC